MLRRLALAAVVAAGIVVVIRAAPKPPPSSSLLGAMGRGPTVVLVHGLWMTPRSWEHWVPYYEEKGFRVLTPGYPGFEIEVEAVKQVAAAAA